MKWLKKFLKILGVFFGLLVILSALARFVIPAIAAVIRPLVVTPSIIRVSLPTKDQKNEPFDLYVGNRHVDGGGAYVKLNRMSDTAWEASAPDNLGSENDLGSLVVMKARGADLKAPASQVSTTKFIPRINGETSQRGMEIVDYWSKFGVTKRSPKPTPN